MLAVLLAAVPVILASDHGLATAQEPPGPKERADAAVEEAQRHWDRQEFDRAIAKYKEALSVFPSGETYKELGDLYSERDMHSEAIAAYRAAVAADSSLEPVLRLSIGQQLLWADQP